MRERFAAAAVLDEAAVAAASERRAAIRARLDRVLGPGTALLLPSALDIAPRLDATSAALDDFRAGTLGLLCPAGHAGLPQVSLPFATLDGCPLGLSVTAARDRDEDLLGLAEELGSSA